jgi:hypothetical protein
MQALISIVDNDASIGSALAWLLKGAGYKARCFISANTFLAAYDPKVPGCVVTDLDHDGDERTRAAKSARGARVLPADRLLYGSRGCQRHRPSHEGGRCGRSLQARAGRKTCSLQCARRSRETRNCVQSLRCATIFVA